MVQAHCLPALRYLDTTIHRHNPRSVPLDPFARRRAEPQRGGGARRRAGPARPSSLPAAESPPPRGARRSQKPGGRVAASRGGLLRGGHLEAVSPEDEGAGVAHAEAPAFPPPGALWQGHRPVAEGPAGAGGTNSTPSAGARITARPDTATTRKRSPIVERSTHRV